MSLLEKFFDEKEDPWFALMPRREHRPAMDVYETESAVVAELHAPNFDPQHIKVSVENRTLRIIGSIKEEQKAQRRGYWQREIRQASFERMVHLPLDVRKDQIEATYEKGVLKVVMPKAETQKSPNIEVKIKGT